MLGPIYFTPQIMCHKQLSESLLESPVHHRISKSDHLKGISIRNHIRSLFTKCLQKRKHPRKPPPPPPPDASVNSHLVRMTSAGPNPEPCNKAASQSTGHGVSALEPVKRSVTPVSLAEPHSDSTGATVIAYKRRPSSSPRFADVAPPSSGPHSTQHNRQNSQSPLTESNVPYSRHSRPVGDSAFTLTAAASASVSPVSAAASASVTARSYQPAIWDLGAKRTAVKANPASAVASVKGDATVAEKMAALNQPGATLSISSYMSSEVYTDDTDDTAVRAALNYPLQQAFGPADPMSRPGPALGYYRDNVGTPDMSEASCEMPPDLLPSPSIQAKLRVLLAAGSRPAGGESDASSEQDIYGSVTSLEDLMMMKQQVHGLEGMYRELLRQVGSDPTAHLPHRPSSLGPAASSVHSGTSAPPARRYLRHVGRRRSHDVKTIGKRVEKLETHVVTLAQSVAEISSELEHLRLHQGSARSSAGASRSMVTAVSAPALEMGPLAVEAPGGCKVADAATKDDLAVAGRAAKLERVRQSLRNTRRLAKLKWFFGCEPPFLKEFLDCLGYEKYVSLFEKEDIGLQELPLMTEERLKALGMPLGPRLRLLEEIRAAFSSEDGNSSTIHI